MSEIRRLLVSLTFVVVTLVFLGLFFSARIASFGVDANTGLPISRAEFLVLLLQSPEFVWRQWIGGDWSRVQISDRLPVLLGAALWLLACWAPGRCLLRLSKTDTHMSSGEVAVNASACGLSLMSLWTLSVGLAGALHRPVLLTLAPAACWAFEIAWRLRNRSAGRNAAATRQPAPLEANAGPGTPQPLWHWFAMAPFAAFLLLASLLPPWSFDARCYHLQAPKEFAQQGGIGFVPHNVYANMPLGAEMHALAAMSLWPGADGWWYGALVGKVVIACCTLLVAAGLYFASCRFSSPLAGAMAAVAYVSIPWVAYVSTTGLIDGVVGMYFALALFAVIRWKQSGMRGRTGWLALAGFMAGSAVACKYPALLFVVGPLMIAVGVLQFRQSADQLALRRRIALMFRTWLVFLIAVGASSGLWFAKNAVLTGNPTYPLLYRVFGGESRNNAKDLQWTRAHSPPKDQSGSSYTWPLVVDSASRVGWSSNWLSPLLWPLCLAGIWFAPNKKLAWSLAGLVAAYFVMWWLITHRIDRFWIPVLPVASLLAGMGAASVRGSVLRVAVPALLLAGLTCNLLVISSRAMGDNRLLVAYQHLRHDLPSPQDGNFSRVNPAHRFLNANMGPRDKVLLVGDARPFDVEGNTLYNTTFDDSLFERLLRGKNRQQRLDSLHNTGVTLVFIYWAGIEEERGPHGYGFTDFVSRDRVRRELVEQQRILIPIPFDMHPELGEIFRVARE